MFGDRDIVDVCLATVDSKDYMSPDYTQEQIELMQQWDNKQWAIFAYFDSDESLIEPISDLDISSLETVEIGKQELWVLTDDEADDRHYDSVEQLVEDELGRDHWLLNFVDIERIVREDDRAGSLASYDGRELEFDVNGETLYIYKVNDYSNWD